MGIYINPTEHSKTRWLDIFGIKIDKPGLEEVKENLFQKIFPVVLINNGAFFAVAVVYNLREFEEFSRGDDRRSKEWYLVGIEQLEPEYGSGISSSDLDFLKKN